MRVAQAGIGRGARPGEPVSRGARVLLVMAAQVPTWRRRGADAWERARASPNGFASGDRVRRRRSAAAVPGYLAGRTAAQQGSPVSGRTAAHGGGPSPLCAAAATGCTVTARVG